MREMSTGGGAWWTGGTRSACPCGAAADTFPRVRTLLGRVLAGAVVLVVGLGPCGRVGAATDPVRVVSMPGPGYGYCVAYSELRATVDERDEREWIVRIVAPGPLCSRFPLTALVYDAPAGAAGDQTLLHRERVVVGSGTTEIRFARGCRPRQFDVVAGEQAPERLIRWVNDHSPLLPTVLGSVTAGVDAPVATQLAARGCPDRPAPTSTTTLPAPATSTIPIGRPGGGGGSAPAEVPRVLPTTTVRVPAAVPTTAGTGSTTTTTTTGPVATADPAPPDSTAVSPLTDPTPGTTPVAPAIRAAGQVSSAVQPATSLTILLVMAVVALLVLRPIFGAWSVSRPAQAAT